MTNWAFLGGLVLHVLFNVFLNYRNAIANSGVNPEDIGQMVFVTSTELSFPGLDTLVIDNLELPKDIFRTPIYNQGCSPALRGLAAAKHFCMDNPGK